MSINAIIEQLKNEVELRNKAIAALQILDAVNGHVEYQEEREKIIQPGPARPLVGISKYCGRCHHLKPISAYPGNKISQDGHEGICKACRNTKTKKKHASRSMPGTDHPS